MAFPKDNKAGNPESGVSMRKRFLISIFTLATLSSLILAAIPAAAQGGAAKTPAAANPRDFNGLWITSTTDLTQDLLPGQEISFTHYGAERYRKVDMALAPANTCQPYGPTRAMQSTYPYQMVQTPGVIAVVFEHIDYRLIYTDGRGHPEDISDYPEWNGHSIGRWEGDTLIVDTVGIIDKSWLDASGLEHSDKLHLIERFQKTGPDSFKWTVTVEDSVFFTKPFTYSRDVNRLDFPRLLPARCADNERDAAHAQTGIVGAQHRNKSVLKFPN